MSLLHVDLIILNFKLSTNALFIPEQFYLFIHLNVSFSF